MQKSNVYIYGNGYECKKVLQRIRQIPELVNVKGIIVSKKEQEFGIENIRLYEFPQIEKYDFIIIAVYNWRDVYQILKTKNVDDAQIILSVDIYKNNLKFPDDFINRDTNFKIIDNEYYHIHEAYAREYKKEAILHYPPRSITIGVTSVCKNKCLFCAYHGEDFKNSSKVYGLPFSLSLSKFKKIVDMAYEGHVPHVHVCGTGEPFANPQILDMLDYVIYKYGLVSVQTEFWPEIFRKHNYLKELCNRQKYIEYITTDLFSANESIHNDIKRGTKLSELLGALKYISQNSNINLHINTILTKKNYNELYKIMELLLENGISNFVMNIVNLFTYEGSDFTSKANVYTSKDNDIKNQLIKAKEYAQEHNIKISIPIPEDEENKGCDHFWTKFQTWPVKGCNTDRFDENMVPMACNAVINGQLNSLGYIFDYDTIMDAWNNPILVNIREKMLRGIYPSDKCKDCYLYRGEIENGIMYK